MQDGTCAPRACQGLPHLWVSSPPWLVSHSLALRVTQYRAYVILTTKSFWKLEPSPCLCLFLCEMAVQCPTHNYWSNTKTGLSDLYNPCNEHSCLPSTSSFSILTAPQSVIFGHGSFGWALLCACMHSVLLPPTNGIEYQWFSVVWTPVLLSRNVSELTISH